MQTRKQVGILASDKHKLENEIAEYGNQKSAENLSAIDRF